ncbi:PEPxxWA-CTERM sorting domain-containing protein [Polymorphobacter megasporae]|uniref:PEPxxWA-CTERM sorting domain-containing protein n=1 Tax=Glacieibacterium megasporae TaxID=2835787 RepID=UPI001CAA44DA|nr:PEPxxWA-CTERM sorting domain-containing protein [Polymorphobacter megasporae]UAJ12621.1 PEPxxWA-CTERM sorting domain-containing protein [Polymorphobacter megasporae]
MSLIAKLVAGAALAFVATAAQAVIPVYPTPGVENPILYTFTAASSGNLTAYFAGSGASYNETLGLLVNGVDTGISGLQNHTTPLGTALSFGNVAAGDALTFLINIQTTGDTFYSQKSRNSDGANHVYSAAYAGGDYGIPAGTYVAFEDLPKGSSDFNYGDEQFVFTNVGTTVPEPAAWALMLGGFGVVGAAMRRRVSSVVVAA